jgi:acetyl-CoA acetyltransferase
MSDLGKVIGVSAVGPYRHDDFEMDYLDLTADALMAAAADAGLDVDAIDGLVVNSGGDAGPDFDQLANFIGLRTRINLQSWAHGRFTASIIYQAALLVKEQQANVVACIYGRRLARDQMGGPLGKGWSEEQRAGGGPHGENPRIGLTAPLGNAALAARLYANRYGAKLDDLYYVVNQLRINAAGYPGALRTGPVTQADYMSNPYVVEPLRRWDCAPRTEGAVCFLVGRAGSSAKPNRAVTIAGFTGLPSGPDEFVWAKPGLGMHNQPILEHVPPDIRAFEMAGVGLEDVQVLFTYDPFSPLVWLALERFGYCAPGEAPSFVGDKTLTRAGKLPTNTHGGSTGAGQLAGWLHMVEAVTQLRREAGPRQVEDASIAHYGSVFGDSMILTR